MVRESFRFQRTSGSRSRSQTLSILSVCHHNTFWLFTKTHLMQFSRRCSSQAVISMPAVAFVQCHIISLSSFSFSQAQIIRRPFNLWTNHKWIIKNKSTPKWDVSSIYRLADTQIIHSIPLYFKSDVNIAVCWKCGWTLKAKPQISAKLNLRLT